MQVITKYDIGIGLGTSPCLVEVGGSTSGSGTVAEKRPNLMIYSTIYLSDLVVVSKIYNQKLNLAPINSSIIIAITYMSKLSNNLMTVCR